MVKRYQSYFQFIPTIKKIVTVIIASYLSWQFFIISILALIFYLKQG